MRVEVTSGTITERYLQATDITKIDSTSKVFFLEESEYEIPEILFGDGKVGKDLLNGDVISVSYSTSSGTGANGLSLRLLLPFQMEVQEQKVQKQSNLLLLNSILPLVEQFLHGIMKQFFHKSIQT